MCFLLCEDVGLFVCVFVLYSVHVYACMYCMFVCVHDGNECLGDMPCDSGEHVDMCQ